MLVLQDPTGSKDPERNGVSHFPWKYRFLGAGGPGVLSLLESFDLVTKLQSQGPTHHGRVMLYL